MSDNNRIDTPRICEADLKLMMLSLENSHKEKFLSCVDVLIDSFNAIDKEVYYTSVEPDWWLDMADIKRKLINIKQKYDIHNKV